MTLHGKHKRWAYRKSYTNKLICFQPKNLVFSSLSRTTPHQVKQFQHNYEHKQHIHYNPLYYLTNNPAFIHSENTSVWWCVDDVNDPRGAFTSSWKDSASSWKDFRCTLATRNKGPQHAKRWTRQLWNNVDEALHKSGLLDLNRFYRELRQWKRVLYLLTADLSSC